MGIVFSFVCNDLYLLVYIYNKEKVKVVEGKNVCYTQCKLQGAELAFLAPTPFIRKGSSAHWYLVPEIYIEHSIEHAHL